MAVKDDCIEVPLSFEHTMSNLFGEKNYHGHVVWVKKTEWKRDLLKIIKYIKKAIEINIESDIYHENKLGNLLDLEKRIKEHKDINELNIEIIEIFTIVIFELIGRLPGHLHCKHPYSDNFWELDEFRKIVYLRSDSQKANLIIHIVDVIKKYKITIPTKYLNLRELYSFKFESNPVMFLDWFKSEYPKFYCEIF
ncbi:hypothetical protein CVT91_01360 [Candidatus Atribacteria bacterium HGW-Atribacteria-1]|nr:MAG: hypothetical protein CVT91_01360 [Candidatus Atribacteria bacterium HGW-Atribacteria-1]